MILLILRSRSSRGWLERALLLLGLGLATACGEGPPPEEQGDQEPLAEVAAVGEQVADSAAGAMRRFLPDAMRRSTRAETFAHDAHVQIDCAVCHQVAQGHGSHDTVECADCHRSSAMATVAALSRDQCASCHHGTEQTLTCEYCHEARVSLASVQELSLEVWSAPRERVLDFDHAWHEALTCESCHKAAPTLIPAEPCASCHDDHHTEAARCQDCHTPPPEGAHDADSHLTCSGSGCHRAPLVEAMSDTRAVCLVCHQDQEEHEPGGNCIECHRVRPGGAAGLAP